ncbi:MAG: RhuM family protein [Albidovulum sp.]
MRATRRQTMRLAEWEGVLDTFLTSNELPKLQGAGSISADAAKRIAHDRYDAFDAKRKDAARQAAAEVDDFEELKRIADAAKAGKKGRGDA